eukprot:scaffold244243_cov39-Attheya_sp.AAC.1
MLFVLAATYRSSLPTLASTIVVYQGISVPLLGLEYHHLLLSTHTSWVCGGRFTHTHSKPMIAPTGTGYVLYAHHEYQRQLIHTLDIRKLLTERRRVSSLGERAQ